MYTMIPNIELETATGETSPPEGNYEAVLNAAEIPGFSDTKDSDKVRLDAASQLLNLSNLTAKQWHQAIAEFFNCCLTTDELLNPSGWEQRENFAYKALLRVPSMQLGALLWQPGDGEDWHLHYACRGGFAFAFIKVMQGVGTHEVADVIGTDPNTGKILITPTRNEVLRTGDVAIVTSNQAHLLANKSAETLLTVHLYITPVRKPIHVERLHIVRGKSA